MIFNYFLDSKTDNLLTNDFSIDVELVRLKNSTPWWMLIYEET
jgi:hypothetical protein